MQDNMQHGDSDSPKRSFFASRANIVLIGFLAIAAFYLVTEHTAHLLGALPWLLVLACPLMHVFLHSGHGGRRSSGDDSSSFLRDERDRPHEH